MRCYLAEEDGNGCGTAHVGLRRGKAAEGRAVGRMRVEANVPSEPCLQLHLQYPTLYCLQGICRSLILLLYPFLLASLTTKYSSLLAILIPHNLPFSMSAFFASLALQDSLQTSC